MTAAHAGSAEASATSGGRPMPLLAIEDLCVAFPALRRGADGRCCAASISTMTPGEVLGLVGESGSGKTMLARAIMQLIPPPGHISGAASASTGSDLARARRGGAAQAARARHRHDHLQSARRARSAADGRPADRQRTALPSAHRAGARSARACSTCCAQVSIPDPERRLDAYPHELSGGMAQRVVIAIALACSPKFIISDDATSGLDVTVQAQVLELMRQLVVERGTSMLFITRDIAHHRALTATASPLSMPAKSWRWRRPRRVLRQSAAPLYGAAAGRLLPQRAAAALLAGRGRGPARTCGAEPASAAPSPNRCVRAQRALPPRASGLREREPDHFVRCHFPVER